VAVPVWTCSFEGVLEFSVVWLAVGLLVGEAIRKANGLGAFDVMHSEKRRFAGCGQYHCGSFELGGREGL
jgi:hypothetical protein